MKQNLLVLNASLALGFTITTFAVSAKAPVSEVRLTAAADDSPDTLAVCVVNASSATSRDQVRMRESATQVFRHAGIRIVWVECRPVPKSTRGTFFVILVDAPPPERRLLGRANHVSSTATVYYKRACAMEKDSTWVVTRGEILGHAIAHEIGHLVLASDAHSLFGIMKADLNRRDLALLGEGRLLFNQEEERLLRIALMAK